MAVFQSTRKYYHFYRYGLGAIGIFLLLFNVILVLFELEITINDNDVIASWENTWFMPIISILLLAIHFLIYKKAAYVKIWSDNVLVESSDGIKEYKTDSIEKIKHIQFLKPPLYIIKIKGAPRTYFFVIYDLYIEFGGFVKDLSTNRQKLDEIKDTLPEV
tara:strand:+ start:177 stop:659 length:483 start_codon:yes stop_codon:yes gene_type:complete